MAEADCGLVPPCLAVLGHIFVLEKLSQAARLYGNNFALIAAVVFTVWLQGNLLLNLLESEVIDPDDFHAWFRLNNFAGLIIGPLANAAVLSVVLTDQTGGTPGYVSAMAHGFRRWFSMFATTFVTNLICGLALLLFIVPGVYMLLRYVLVGPIVVAEGQSVSRAMERSSEIMMGHKWWMLVAGPIMLLLTLVPAVAISEGATWILITQVDLPLAILMPATVITSTMFDLVAAFIPTFLFVCYWDFSGAQSWYAEAAPDEDADAAAQIVAVRTAEVDDDPNPYRVPRFD